MTQESLAEYLGVSVSAVSQWEAEKTMPDLSLIAPICNLFGISSDELPGINLAQKEKKINEICEKADSIHAEGTIRKHTTFSKTVCANFPTAIR